MLSAVRRREMTGGQPYKHVMEDDLDRWVEVAALAGIIRFERLLRRHAAFEEFYEKRTAPVSEGR